MSSVERTFHIVLRKSPRYWRTPEIARMTIKKPTLKLGELAVKITLSMRDDLFELPAAAVTINPDNLIRPEVRAS